VPQFRRLIKTQFTKIVTADGAKKFMKFSVLQLMSTDGNFVKGTKLSTRIRNFALQDFE
jgi:hypothetical protein